MGNNTRFDSPVIVHSVYAAGTTQFVTQRGSAATNFTLSGVLRSASGLQFTGNNAKQFAAGTYFGVGGATAPITSTGLTTIAHVFLQVNKTAYSTATTGMAYGRPCIAAGTPGSFYPILFKTGTIGGGGPVLNTVAGTFRWFAMGAGVL